MAFNQAKLGEQIKKYRKQKSMSQKELSNLSNLSKSTIARLETGKSPSITIEKIERIAIALCVSVDDLLKDSLLYYVPKEVSKSNPYIKRMIFKELEQLDEKKMRLFADCMQDFIEYKFNESK